MSPRVKRIQQHHGSKSTRKNEQNVVTGVRLPNGVGLDPSIHLARCRWEIRIRSEAATMIRKPIIASSSNDDSFSLAAALYLRKETA